MSDAPAVPNKAKARRTWRQRIRIAVLVVLILACVFRIALTVLLPTIIRRIARSYDLDCQYSRMDLSLSGANAQLWNFVLRPKTGGESIISADYVHGDISALNLLRGRLVVYRAEVDGVNVVVEREADGSIPLLKKVLSPDAQPAVVAPTAASSPKSLNLQSPLRVDAVRASHVETTFRDRSVSPSFEVNVKTDLRISDVGSGQSPTRFELEIAANPVLDTLLVQGVARNAADALSVDAQLVMRGLHLKTAEAYLAPMGIKPIADSMTIRGDLKLAAHVIANSPNLSAQLSVSKLSVTGDGVEYASLETVSIDAKKLSTTAAELASIAIENGKLSAERTGAGRVRIAAIEFAPAPPSVTPTLVVPATKPARTAATLPAAAPAYRFALDRLHLKNLQAAFDDRAVHPTANMIARLDDMTINNVNSNAASPSDPPIAVDGRFSLPGVADQIRLRGTFTAFAPAKSIHFIVDGGGVKPDALKPYFDQIGIESTLESGSFAATFDASAFADADGKLKVAASAKGIRFDDGNTPLFAFDSAKVTGLTIDPATAALAIDAIELAGPTMEIRRDATGQFNLAGLRTLPRNRKAELAEAGPSSVTTPHPIDPAAPATSLVMPRVQLGRFRWKDVHVAVRDEFHSPPTSLALGDSGLEIDDLLVDLTSAQRGSNPGTFRAWLSIPRVIEEFNITGTVNPGPQRLDVTMNVAGKGMNGDALSAYLAPLGIAPTLKSGAIALSASASVRNPGGKIGGSLEISDLRYTDGPIELAAVDRLALTNVVANSSSISIDGFYLVNPRSRATRHADGTFEAAGIRTIGIATTQRSARASTPAAPTSPLALRLPAWPISAVLNDFSLQNGAIEWNDDALPVAAQIRAAASVTLRDAHVDASSTPAALHIDVKVDGSLDRATVDGMLTCNPQAPAATLSIVAEGMRAGGLSAYMPANIRPTLNDGRFTAIIHADAANHPSGGVAAELRVNDVVFEDRADHTKWAGIDAFKIDATRIDPAGGAIAFREISSAGARALVRKMTDGSIEAMGIRISSVPSRLAESAADSAMPASHVQARPPIAQTAPDPAPDTAPDTDTAPVTAPDTAPDTGTLVANARRALPLLTVDSIDLGLQAFRVEGMTGANGSPLVVSNVRLKNVQPISAGGADAENRPPMRLSVDGAIDLIASHFSVNVEAMPFAVEPTLSVDLNATGIRGEGLTAIAPNLRQTLDGSPLTDGTFHTHLNASVNYGRRGSRDFDLSRGFTTTFDVKPIEFRSAPSAPIIAGVEEIRGEGIKVEPKSGNVQLSSIEISKPIGRFTREADGVHAFGLVVKLPVDGNADSPQGEHAIPPVAVAPTSEAAPLMPVRPKSEVRLDRLTISGIDVTIEDKTTKPPTLVPLAALDVEINDVSNQLAWNGKPIRFNVLCTSAKVPLPPRKGASGGVPTTTGSDGSYAEMRELFSQITASGRVGVKPTSGRFALDGWAKTSVNGFELLGVRGLAQTFGVTIGGGVFDDTNDVRFQPDGLIKTNSRIVFTNLSLSEPAGGPLEKLFKLPAPIDFAIGTVTDPDGSITLPLPLDLKNGMLNGSDVVGPAIGAIGSVLITGIASAPMKAAGGIGDLVGLGGKKGAAPEVAVLVHFFPGSTEFDPAGLEALNELALRLRSDENVELQLHHQLTAGDVARAAVRANPSAADCLLLAEQVREQKRLMLGQRAVLSAQARGDIGSHAGARATASVERLRALDRQIAQAENALDQIYDLLRPDAASQAGRRTRAASLDIARERFNVVHQMLARFSGGNIDARVHAANPQFDPSDSNDGGDISILAVVKKH